MIKIGLIQYHPTASLDDNLRWIKGVIDADKSSPDIICFSHDFLGPDYLSQKALNALIDIAGANEIEILTGRLGLPSGGAQSVLISSEGIVAGSVPMGMIDTIDTVLGPTVVLSEKQAYDPRTDDIVRNLRPRAMIMQANANSLLELEAIKELAIDRSFNQAHLVVCASDVGPYADEECLGVSLAVFQGEILVEADLTATGVITFSVEMDNYLDYDVLRDPVNIPELLRRKYSPGQ